MVLCIYRLLAGALTVTLLALPAIPVQARDKLPTAIGDLYFPADTPPPPILPPLQSAPEAAAWEARITEALYEGGPYAPQLAETLQDAGNYFYSRGDYRSAIDHWRRAVHLTRVNDGLYSELQLPILRRLLDTYLETGDYESADNIQAYLYHLSRQHHGPRDIEYIEATVAWVDWRRQQWLRGPRGTDPKELLSLWRLVDRQSRESEEAQLSAAQLAPLVSAQLDMLHVIGVAHFGLDREAEMMLGGRPGEFGVDMDTEQAHRLQDSAYSRGRKRLELLGERMAEAGDKLGQAKAQLALGDWHMWNDAPALAANSYRECWNTLAAAGQAALQGEWFGEPVALPANGELWSGPGTPEEFAESALVLARFTVTTRGRAEDIDTEARDPEQAGSAIRFSRMLRSSRFRPRLEAGEPVDSGPLLREYRVR